MNKIDKLPACYPNKACHMEDGTIIIVHRDDPNPEGTYSTHVFSEGELGAMNYWWKTHHKDIMHLERLATDEEYLMNDYAKFVAKNSGHKIAQNFEEYYNG